MTVGVHDILARLERREADEAAEAGVTVDDLRERRSAEERRTQLAQRERADRDRDAEISRMLEAAGVPTRALAVAQTGLDTPALSAVRAPTDAIITVLAGVPGAGKTVAAALWMLRYGSTAELWTYGGSGTWESRGEVYAHRWRGGKLVWRGAGELARTDHYSRDAVGELTTAARLVIDDLGAEYADGKGFFLSLLDELVNARYASNRATVITTNLDAPTFRLRYGDRIADRIREAGRFVNCGATSLRGKARS
jgi:hypothetical protein